MALSYSSWTIGTKVLKYFESPDDGEWRPYEGRVVEIDNDDADIGPLYKILYDADGDTEDFDTADMEKYTIPQVASSSSSSSVRVEVGGTGRKRAVVNYKEQDDDDDDDEPLQSKPKRRRRFDTNKHSEQGTISDGDDFYVEDSKPSAKRQSSKKCPVARGSGGTSAASASFLKVTTAMTENETKPEAVTSQPKQEKRPVVEFLFRSYKTQLFREGGLQGSMHVEMYQDPVSGRYSIPVGETPFTVNLSTPVKPADSWCMGTEGCTKFSGTFSRSTANGPISMDTGLILDYASGNHRSFKATVRPREWKKKYPDYSEIKTCGSQAFEAQNLSSWEHGQGGFLELVASVSTEWTNFVRWGWYGGTYGETRGADGKYKIKLYTVLSVYKPQQDQSALPNYANGVLPDWNALIGVVAARNPDKDKAWAERAVQQYSYFMDLKLDPNLAKQKFSPSCMIDEIWHAHLSFPERYQRDMVCLTHGKSVPEHLPVHYKQSAQYYKKAHTEHSKRVQKQGRTVDQEFWPDPMPYDPSQHENSSDNEKMIGKLIHGKPSSSNNAGCGGCG